MPKLGDVETVEVVHADGSRGVTKLRVIGVVKQPAAPEAVATGLAADLPQQPPHDSEASQS